MVKVQSQANETQSISNGISTDRAKGTAKAFKSYLCNRYARKRAQDSETTYNGSPMKLTEGAQLRQSNEGPAAAVTDDGQNECKASRQTDFDDLEGWTHLQSPDLLAARGDSHCAEGLVQRPCMDLSPAAGEIVSQSVLPPLADHGQPSEQDLLLPTPTGAVSPPDSIPDWEDDLDTLLFEGDGSDCSCSDETDAPLSPGDLTFSSELEMDTDIEGESQPFQLTQEHGTATEDPLQTAADLNLQICGQPAPTDTKPPDHTVPEAQNTIRDDFDCLDSCAFFDGGESEHLLNREAKAKDRIAPNCSSEQNTQWNEFHVQENDFQW